MTIKEALAHARVILAANNIEDVSLECEVLLRQALNIDRVQLYLDLDGEVSPEQAETFWYLIKRRLSGEPVAYITRHCEFYGLDFYVDPRVLIPRPETELLVEKALNLTRNQPVFTIADIGTGCGAIAISLALNLPQAKVYATDISTPALKVALLNAQRHGVVGRICFLQGNMLDPLPESVDLIVANLPYVQKLELANAVNFEPLLALDGGSDGLKRIRRLCRQVSGKLHPEGCLLLEIGRGQGRAVTALLRALFPQAKVEVTHDLSDIGRMVSLILSTAVIREDAQPYNSRRNLSFINCL